MIDDDDGFMQFIMTTIVARARACENFKRVLGHVGHSALKMSMLLVIPVAAGTEWLLFTAQRQGGL